MLYYSIFEYEENFDELIILYLLSTIYVYASGTLLNIYFVHYASIQITENLLNIIRFFTLIITILAFVIFTIHLKYFIFITSFIIYLLQKIMHYKNFYFIHKFYNNFHFYISRNCNANLRKIYDLSLTL